MSRYALKQLPKNADGNVNGQQKYKNVVLIS